MKLVAIDYGRRRIGLAASDEQAITVRGLATIDRLKHPDTLDTLARIIQQEKPERIVFGLPLDCDDRETTMSLEVREFARQLSERLPIAIEFFDESFSSHRAAELLRFRKKKTRQDKAMVDRMAACLLLQEYIRNMQAQQGV
jgi:putative Holliday junction resolvase